MLPAVLCRWTLRLQERLTMLPFLLSFLDYDSSPEVYNECAFWGCWPLGV